MDFLFGAARPATGEGFALALPEVSTATKAAFLERIADHPVGRVAELLPRNLRETLDSTTT